MQIPLRHIFPDTVGILGAVILPCLSLALLCCQQHCCYALTTTSLVMAAGDVAHASLGQIILVKK